MALTGSGTLPGSSPGAGHQEFSPHARGGPSTTLRVCAIWSVLPTRAGGMRLHESNKVEAGFIYEVDFKFERSPHAREDGAALLNNLQGKRTDQLPPELGISSKTSILKSIGTRSTVTICYAYSVLPTHARMGRRSYAANAAYDRSPHAREASWENK